MLSTMPQTASTSTTQGNHFTAECEADVEGRADDTADDAPGNVLTNADDSGPGAADSDELKSDDVGKEAVTGKEN
jgi:hypothetical protein